MGHVSLSVKPEMLSWIFGNHLSAQNFNTMYPNMTQLFKKLLLAITDIL